ncbi:MAG: DUF2284 domain-containing protein [Deltaproteobacteria bacterium]|jgi:predicted metal-binding protein|nr:DUF2284 domain-containing protein [Deltaproteobacteria bacterium]
MPERPETLAVAFVEALNPSAVKVTDLSSLSFNPEFRSLCEANHCGHYDKNWTCPPRVGELAPLIEEVGSFEKALVYQLVGKLSHPMDWKGVLECGSAFNRISYKIADELRPKLSRSLLLGAGPCRYCGDCAFPVGEPCRHPDKAVRSLEANCVDVSFLARSCGLGYINGPDTIRGRYKINFTFVARVCNSTLHENLPVSNLNRLTLL